MCAPFTRWTEPNTLISEPLLAASESATANVRG